MATLADVVLTRLVQLDVKPGAPRENAERMLAHIAAARSDGVALLLFPELAVPGCLLGDEWERPSFLRECEECGRAVAAAARGLAVLFGNVAVDWERRNEDGRPRKFNALFCAEDGRLLAPEGLARPFAAKALQPNYREFDDDRHFFGARRLAAENGHALEREIAPFATRRAGRVGGMLCEDAWESDYSHSPGSMLAAKGAGLLAVASCSPFTRGKQSKRHRVCGALARATGLPLLYVNNVGVQDIGKTVFVFDGGSCCYDGAGALHGEVTPFEEGALTMRLPAGGPAGGRAPDLSGDGVARVAQALLHGAGAFMRRLGVRRVTIGLSGGIDSAVAAALYRRLLPAEDLLLVGMPGPHTSATTRRLARGLAAKLGARWAEAPIVASVDRTRAQFAALATEDAAAAPAGALALDGAALENVQARDRGSRVLMAAAAAFGGVVSCNANKAEMTVGYGTLYGDILGWLALLGDLWKGEVYELARHLNETLYGEEIIPEEIFALKPSAELSAAQAVEQGLGDPLNYPYHDRLFRAWVERWERVTPEETLAWYLEGRLESEIGYEGSVAGLFPTPAAFIGDLERWWNLHQGLAVAKRLQAPPVLAVSRRAFGFDLREAQLGPRYSARYLELRRRALECKE